MDKTKLCAQYFKDGEIALKNKQYTKALYLFRYILKYFPKDSSSNYLYGDTCLKVRDYSNAIKYIIKTKDKFENELFYNLSLAKSYEFIDLNQSEFFYKKIFTLSKNNLTSIELLGFFYKNKKKDFKLSEYYFLLGLDKNDNKYSFAYNLGVLYQENKIYNKAIYFYNLAIQNKNNLHSIYNNLGNCYVKLDKISLAILMFKKSIQCDGYLSSSYINLGALYKKIKRYKSALWIYSQGSKSIHIKDILWEMSLLKILMGDLKYGLELYDTRLMLNKFKKFLPSFNGNRWQREDISNKVLLISTEQGFGDMIFFFRYIQYVLLLKPKKIIILAPKELKELFSIDKKIEIILENDKNIQYDYYCYIMSLAYLFYENNSLIPNQVPYLSSSNKIINIDINRNKFNIFLVWNSFSDGEDVKQRNIDLSLLFCLSSIKNTNFYSMLDSNIDNFNIKNISSYINDFNDTAIIIKKMDLVICIDTAIAHLSGALNIPCFVILPFNSNWRWGLENNKVSHYPSIKLFKGDKKNGFNNICINLKIAINDMMANGFIINSKEIGIDIQNIINSRNYIKNINNQALSYLYNKEYNNSLKCSVQSLSIFLNSFAFMNIALVYLKTNEFKKALWNLKESISLQENDENYFHLGVCFLKLKNTEEAIKSFKNSIKINPLNIRSKHNLAFIYAKENMNLEAIAINLDILSINSINLQALESLAVLYDRELDNKNALSYYNIVENKDNISFSTKLNMASFYFRNNKYNKSKKLLKQLISNNQYLEQSNQILGSIYKKELNIDKAIAHYLKSISLNKNDKTLIWNLGFLYLSKGNYLKGFSFIEKRYETNLLSKKEFLKSPKYNNEDLNKKILYIYMEQGFGDNILLVRYIELIKKRYPESIIYLSSRKELLILFKGIKQIDKIFDTEDIKEHYDYHISLFSMPFIFKTTINTVPNNFPYIFPNKQDEYNLNLDNNFINIGIVWSSGNFATNQEERSISLESFDILSKDKNIKLFSLQKGDASKEIKNISININDLSSKINNFNDTANIILKLDLIISVDTAVAHLSGALNKKCFVILPKDTNWRWGLSGDKSPWFNSLKLFRLNHKTIKDLFIDIKKYI
jgi:ADP-heptose:LPS heptosyltransferase/Tfp pilus assembly protein PilF